MAFEPLLSVVLPIFNSEAYLRVALASVLNTYDNLEVLAVNDGSTDGSSSILEEFARLDKRLRVFELTRSVIVVALQRGIAEAKGKYIARMDSDDICSRNRFHLQVQYMESHPSCVALGGQALQMTAEGWPVSVWPTPLSHTEILERYKIGRIGIIHPTVMFRADALRKVGGYRREDELAEDIRLILSLSEIGTLQNLPDIVLNYRRHSNSSTYTSWTKQMMVGRRIVEEWAREKNITVPAIPEADFVAPTPRTLRTELMNAAYGNCYYRSSIKLGFTLIRRYPLNFDLWIKLLKSLIRFCQGRDQTPTLAFACESSLQSPFNGAGGFSGEMSNRKTNDPRIGLHSK